SPTNPSPWFINHFFARNCSESILAECLSISACCLSFLSMSLLNENVLHQFGTAAIILRTTTL
ncbi:MAG: hypothetical protein KDE66_01645, partial [Nitrosomonas sp.]|nr:hypothetical protein [Nitrosomonas sp.]